jgi:hypothetical protein
VRFSRFGFELKFAYSSIYAIVIWIIVPILIFTLLMLALIIISDIKQPDPKVSAIAGFGTGLMVFIVYVIIPYVPGL